MRTWQEIRAERGTDGTDPEWLRSANAIAQLRDARGVSVAELAQRAGLTADELAALEVRPDVGLDVVVRCIEALGGTVSLRALFGDETLGVDHPLGLDG